VLWAVKTKTISRGRSGVCCVPSERSVVSELAVQCPNGRFVLAATLLARMPD
jgi:hypothetical protein